MALLFPLHFKVQGQSLLPGFLGVSGWKDKTVWALCVFGFQFHCVHLLPSPVPFVASSSPFPEGCCSPELRCCPVCQHLGQEAFPWEPWCQQPVRTGPHYLPPLLPLLSEPRTKELGACRLAGCLSRVRPSLAQMLSKQECQPH